MPSGTGSFQLPVPTMLGGTPSSGSFAIPLFQFEGSGNYNALDNIFAIPIPVLAGAGRVRSGTGIFSLPAPIMAGTGLVGILGSGIFVIPVPTFTSPSVGGVTGSGIFELPMPILHEMGIGHAYGTFGIPVLSLWGYGRSIPISKIYKGVAMNINNQAITTYSGFSYNSLAGFNGKYFGANDSGIYLLGGNTDLGRRILSNIKTGSLNLGNDSLKYIRNIWLTFRSDGHLALILFVDEDEDNPVEQQTEIVSDKIKEERIKAPRGMRGRFYTVGLKNLSGADFDLNSLSILVDMIKRKVR